MLVKAFHLWGADSNIATSTIHDAFFTNAAYMLPARDALKKIYADAVSKESIKATLDELRKRGLPKEVYDAFYEEAVLKGLIPVAGKSVVGGKVLSDSDILKREDVLEWIDHTFRKNRYFYGVG